MINDNKIIQQKIKKEFLLLNAKRNIKIPSGIHLFLSGNSVRMKLSGKAVCSNMQKNDGAFDGWAIVLKRWGEYENIIISWEKPEVIDNGHYQRFLFRVKHFSEDFQSWFSIEKDSLKLLKDLKIKESETYFLNMPSKRGSVVKDKPEAMLENCFVNEKDNLHKSLMNISNATSVYRQLPVGVFKDKVSKKTSIFTRGGSAIDIWGFNKENELLVFELKAHDSEMVGIISELYFYVNVLQKVRKQIFKHENCTTENEHLLKIPKTKQIRAYFLTPTLHPLIDQKVLKLLNSGTLKEISFQSIGFKDENKFTLDTFN